ncbi:myelin expression factor 2 isoform X2 [Homalodisca vitripennis]|nr:myelin expression factor 2 isoform X2 [Homalodisca vitripennis]
MDRDMDDDSRDRSPNRDDRGGRDRERSRRGDRPSRFSGGPGGGGGGGGFRDRSPIRGDRRRGPSDRRVYVSNIAYEFRWQELKDLFRQEVGEVAFVELFVDENDKPRGCGIIEFESKELAQKAVEKMHRYELKGRKLVVKEDFDIERDKQGRPVGRNMGGRDHDGGGRQSMGNSRIREPDRVGMGGGMPGGMGGGMGGGNAGIPTSKWGNTYGLSPQFLESLHISSPLVTRVFVANLDYKVDDKKLRDVFKLAGRVHNAEISVDKEGKSRGFGVVEFEHPVEAVQAISMLHNQMLYDRRLSVRMDRVEKPDGPPKLPEGLKGIGMGLGANGTPLQDVARNLPSIAQNIQPSMNLANAVSAPSLTTAALGPSAAAALAARGGAGAAAGLGLGTGDLAGLGSGLSAAALGGLAGNNPFMAQLGAAGNSLLGAGALGGAGLGGGGLGVGGGGLGGGGLGGGGMGGGGPGLGRDFDSLSAALGGGGGGGYNSNNMERDFRGPPPNNMANNGRDPMSDTIMIKNLPPTATWQQLKDKFRDAGEVKFAELRGKDIGIIQFASKWDAERALNMMDRVRWDGRTLDVRYY